jgi:nitroimidazol reductase NimA-like FMN-containing flavoprotein (pyridoxamine 5'-phosphate oxidase superfamily)
MRHNGQLGEEMTIKEKIPVETQKGVALIPERLKTFNSKEYFAVLATGDGSQPYTSLIAYALTHDMKKIIFATPRNTRKYTNIIHSANVALLIDNRSKRKKNLLETEAITIIGIAKPVKKGKTWNELAKTFLMKHPDLEEFIKSPATALMAVDITRCLHVGRFQTVSVLDYSN